MESVGSFGISKEKILIRSEHKTNLSLVILEPNIHPEFRTFIFRLEKLKSAALINIEKRKLSNPHVSGLKLKYPSISGIHPCYPDEYTEVGR